MKNVKSKKMLFDANGIAAKLSDALLRDLSLAKRLYGYSAQSGENEWVEIQSKQFLKKFDDCDAGNVSLLEDCAFEKFLDCNEKMIKANQYSFPAKDNLRLSKSMSHDERLLRRARMLMHEILGDFDTDEFTESCRHSSGVSLGVDYVDTSIEAKFSFPITCSSRADSIFAYVLSTDLRLTDSIVNWNKTHKGNSIDLVDTSRAVTVPKSSTSRRMIAVGPTANMYLQQGYMSMMYDKMSHHNLDVKTLPDFHKKLARESSITGLNATIDFSSASDMISHSLVKYLLPSAWFHVADALRSENITIAKQLHKLHMMSTMGNACTFPIMTLVLYTLACASLQEGTETNSMFVDSEHRDKVSVFGDDCILPVTAANRFIEIVTSLGLEVNIKKSFFTPYPGFRESCGGDYYCGKDVRAFHLKNPHTQGMSSLEPWLYIYLNAIYKKFFLNFGSLKYVYLTESFQCVAELFRTYKLSFKFVPTNYPSDSGFQFAFDYDRFPLKGIKLSDIYINKHGTKLFNRCEFSYNGRKNRRFDDIRYAIWIKRPIISDTGESMFTIRKALGGYVIVKGMGRWRRTTFASQ